MGRVRWHWVGCVVAGIGAAAHVYFAFIETIKWKFDTVREIAPTWVDGVKDAAVGVEWAKRLAFNIGIYNLVLALGLAWTCRAFATRAPIASALGTFFAICCWVPPQQHFTRTCISRSRRKARSACCCSSRRSSPASRLPPECCYRAGWSSRNTIWVGRTKCKATSRITSTVLMYISAMASTE